MVSKTTAWVTRARKNEINGKGRRQSWLVFLRPGCAATTAEQCCAERQTIQQNAVLDLSARPRCRQMEWNCVFASELVENNHAFPPSRRPKPYLSTCNRHIWVLGTQWKWPLFLCKASSDWHWSGNMTRTMEKQLHNKNRKTLISFKRMQAFIPVIQTTNRRARV